MTTLRALVWVEWQKAVRSRMTWFTLLGFLFMPMGITLLMLIYKNPDVFRLSGLLAVKANLLGGTANWPTFLNLLKQATALGGFMLFTLVISWVFGREFVDGTLKDLLAVPVSRATVLLAKFIVTAAWAMGLMLAVFVVTIVLGVLIDLPEGSVEALVHGGLTLGVTAVLVLATAIPAALFASIGRGYLLPIGIAVLALLMANLLVIAGLGEYLPWAIPSLYAGASPLVAELKPASFVIVFLTGLAGIVGTYVWWQTADQNR